MVVEVYPFPTGAITPYTSRRYTVTANGVPSFAYGYELTGNMTSPHYPGLTVEASFTFVGSDETVEFVVARHAPGSPGSPVAITSIAVWPITKGITSEVVAGVARVRVPKNTVAWVTTNGDYANPMILMNDPPAPSIAGAVNYLSLGAVTSFAPGTRVYFPPGVHVLNGPVACPTGGTYLFKINSGCDVYLQGGAIVIGNFDVTGSSDVRISGPGLLSGAFAPWAGVQALSFPQQVTFAQVYNGTPFTPRYIAIDRLKLTRAPFFSVYYAASSYNYVHFISPNLGNVDAINGFLQPAPDVFDVEAKHCFAYVGDSGVQTLGQNLNFLVEDCFVVSPNNGCYLVGYWGDAVTGRTTTFRRCVAMQLGNDDSGQFGPPAGPGPFPYIGNNATLVWWCDTRNDQPGNGRANLLIEDYEVTGPSCSRAFAIMNQMYPSGGFGAFSNDAAGVTYNWVIDGFTCATLPRQRAVLWGRDRTATPSRIYFDRVRIGGVPVNTANWSEFVDQNSSPYFIFVGGKEVISEVDIVNMGLSYAGQSARVTSIAPLDGTVEADVAVRHYTQRVNSLLSRHRWSFATRTLSTVAVTNGATARWAYCYELPSNYLALQALLPSGVTDTDAGLSPAHYTIELDAAGVQRVYTDVEVALIVYTSTVTNPNLFSTLFVEALAWDLAAVFAAALIKDPAATMQKHCLQMREMTLMGARATDADQRFVASQFTLSPSSINARA